MDYFHVLFTLMSIECILLNEDAENMSIGDRVSIISSGRNQQWAKLFHHLRPVTGDVTSTKQNMSRFLKTCKVGSDFKSCVHILGKGGKMAIPANQPQHKGLKYSEFRCRDVSSGWNLPETVVYHCVGSLNMLSHFGDYLQN